jgi:hypothetical protein
MIVSSKEIDAICEEMLAIFKEMNVSSQNTIVSFKEIDVICKEMLAI